MASFTIVLVVSSAPTIVSVCIVIVVTVVAAATPGSLSSAHVDYLGDLFDICSVCR